MAKDKHLGLKIDAETLFKIQYIAKYEGRTGNAQVIQLVRECIREFEKEHGPIEVKTTNGE